jgi:Tfp pilus assembly protein FimT
MTILIEAKKRRQLLPFRGNRSASGYSIVELMFIGMIMAILGNMAVTQIQQSLTNYRLVASARVVAAELNAARALAVSRNWIYEVEFETTDNTIQIVDADDSNNNPRTAKFLETGIIIHSTPSDPIRFYSGGHARGGTVVLRDPDGVSASVVVSASGKVEIG